jgi:hypothetical protein
MSSVLLGQFCYSFTQGDLVVFSAVFSFVLMFYSPVGLVSCLTGFICSFQCAAHVHVRHMSSEVEPCVVWALRVLLPFLI